MVMPLRDDDIDRRTVPVVTYVLIAINVLVWLLELGLGEQFINGYSTVPFEITHNRIWSASRNPRRRRRAFAIRTLFRARLRSS